MVHDHLKNTPEQTEPTGAGFVLWLSFSYLYINPKVFLQEKQHKPPSKKKKREKNQSPRKRKVKTIILIPICVWFDLLHAIPG
jgi:hypothetical protein